MSRRIFSRILSPDFSPHFCGKNQEAPQYLQKGRSRKKPPSFLHFNGVVCSNTLFSNTSALTILSYAGQILHARFSNTSFARTLPGFQFCGPLARTNVLSALCGLPKKVPRKNRVTLLVGIEMSFSRYRDFSIFFSVSRSSLTSTLQDVEAHKSTDRLIPRRGRYRC